MCAPSPPQKFQTHVAIRSGESATDTPISLHVRCGSHYQHSDQRRMIVPGTSWHTCSNRRLGPAMRLRPLQRPIIASAAQAQSHCAEGRCHKTRCLTLMPLGDLPQDLVPQPSHDDLRGKVLDRSLLVQVDCSTLAHDCECWPLKEGPMGQALISLRLIYLVDSTVAEQRLRELAFD